jgi:hypothetical protein
MDVRGAELGIPESKAIVTHASQPRAVGDASDVTLSPRDGCSLRAFGQPAGLGTGHARK